MIFLSRSLSSWTARPDLLPVVIGGDIGAYALARALYEATGQRVALLSPSPIEVIRLSAFIDVIEQESRDADALLTRLLRLVEGRPARSAVVIGNQDSVARFLAEHRSQLEPTYVVPFPSLEAMDALSHKVHFAAACAAAGLRTPRQLVVTGADLAEGDPVIDIPFPLIGKAAIGSDWDALEFPGKRKIYEIDDAAALSRVWADLRAAGFDSTFLIQERVPGADEAMRSITVYMASDGRMTMAASARVLLEDHAPTLIGNPVAMLTEPYPDLWEKVGRLLSDAGYQGFANFDLKVDPVTGEPVFFELNPRIGRNCYYCVAGGVNPMVPMICDLVDGEPGPRREARREALYSLVPLHLIAHQVEELALVRRAVRLAVRQGGVIDPLASPSERSLKRRALVTVLRLNQDRKFHRYRPRRLLRRRG